MGEDLEEIAEQTSIRVNEGRIAAARATGLTSHRISSMRTFSAKRKRSPSPSQPSGPRAELVIDPPTIPTCIARPVMGYKGLVETCRQRANELALSRLEIDRLAGLPAGYSAKLLGKDDGIPRKKRMWPASLEAILGTLGLQIIVVEDPAATSRTLSRRIPVDHSQQRFENKCNSKPVPQLAPPQSEPAPASRSHLRVIQGKRRGSKYG